MYPQRSFPVKYIKEKSYVCQGTFQSSCYYTEYRACIVTTNSMYVSLTDHCICMTGQIIHQFDYLEEPVHATILCNSALVA